MAIEHSGEPRSNDVRRQISAGEPISLRTFTPTQVAISKSAGVFHWTADGRKLYDYTSGVLVTNLGHNPVEWQKRFLDYFANGQGTRLALRGKPLDPSRTLAELEKIKAEGRGIACLSTEPYLGGGGSYHPPKAYLQTLRDFCRQNNVIFILDEIQANF